MVTIGSLAAVALLAFAGYLIFLQSPTDPVGKTIIAKSGEPTSTPKVSSEKSNPDIENETDIPIEEVPNPSGETSKTPIDIGKKLPQPGPDEAATDAQKIEWALKNGLLFFEYVSGGETLSGQHAASMVSTKPIDSITFASFEQERYAAQAITALNSISRITRVTISGGSQLSAPIMKAISGLEELENLNCLPSISVAQLASIPIETRHRMQRLGLLGAHFTNAEIIEVSKLFPNVQSIMLNGYNLTSGCISALNSMPLYDIHFRHISLNLQAGLGGLKSVEQVTFEYATCNDFRNLPTKIRGLEYRNGSIRPPDFKQLVQYKTLDTLTIRDSNVDQDGLTAFKAASPGCSVSYEPLSARTQQRHLTYAFERGMRSIDFTINGELFPNQTDAEEATQGIIESITNIQIQQQIDFTEFVIRNMNSIADLTDLTIYGTPPLGSEVVKMIGELPSLRRLGIHCPFQVDLLDSLPPAMRQRLESLSLICEAGGEKITDAKVAGAAKVFTNITTIELDSAFLTTASIQTLKTLPLKKVVLAKPNAEILASLGALTSIETLQLDNISDADLSHLPPNMKSLTLNHTQLTASNFDQLAKYKFLKTIVSRFAKVDPGPLATFRIARPDCEFKSDFEQ